MSTTGVVRMINREMEPYEIYERMMADKDDAYDSTYRTCMDCDNIRVPEPPYNESYAKLFAKSIGGNDGKAVEMVILSEHEDTALACCWCTEMGDFVDARDDVEECEFYVPRGW